MAGWTVYAICSAIGAGKALQIGQARGLSKSKLQVMAWLIIWSLAAIGAGFHWLASSTI